jgi:DNA-binding PadR family transcriptional regulator
MRTIPRQTSALTTKEAVVLGLLAEGERSGYDLLKRAEGSVAYMWSPAKSHLYAVLPRLVEGGLARRRNIRQRRRPDKQLYRLTPAGRAAVRAWLEDVPARSWDELMLKVFFAGLASRASLVRQLRDFAEAQHQVLAEYRAIRPKTRYGELTLRYGLELMPARLAWLEEVIKELSR